MTGKQLFDAIYEYIIKHEDVELWYSDDYYSIGECWERSASDAICFIDASPTDVLNLMRYIIKHADEDENAWCYLFDGMSFELAEALHNKWIKR